MKSLIFDFDGVIGDTFEISAEFIAKQAKISLPRAKTILVRDGMKNQKDRLFYRLIKTWYYRKLLHFFKERGSLIFSDRLAEIKTLWKDNPKAILTRSDGRICRALLGEDQEMFEFIIGRDKVNTKLDGLKIVTLSSRFKLEDCIFFTDSVGDYKEMSKLLKPGQIYAVSWGFQPREILETCFAKDRILDSFKDFTID
jgi:phosphoglycolate phosphatase-like HAD superfamily hydrolase